MGLINNDLFNSEGIDFAEIAHQKDLKVVKEEIANWVNEHCSFSADLVDSKKVSPDEIKDYEIDDDLNINVNSNINVRSDENLPENIKFGKIGASFFMMGQKLTNTNGFPSEIKENLWLYDNAIEEITDFPTYIGGNCCLRHNKIKNLNGITTTIIGNLDVCDNVEDFDYSPRTDGATINVGVSFYGSVKDGELEKYKNKESKYVGIGGDKDEFNVAFAKYLDEKQSPIKVGCVAKKGFVWHSKGDI